MSDTFASDDDTLADAWDRGWQDCFAYYASAEVGVQLTAEGQPPPHLPHPSNPYRRTE